MILDWLQTCTLTHTVVSANPLARLKLIMTLYHVKSILMSTKTNILYLVVIFRQKKICLFPVTQQTLIFCSDPKVFIALEDNMQ